MSANSSFHGTFHSNAVYMVQNIEKDEVTPGSFYKVMLAGSRQQTHWKNPELDTCRANLIRRTTYYNQVHLKVRKHYYNSLY